MNKERILVTSALPYANGPLHIGHAIGAYIPADVYTRYHRLRGNDIVFICGTDEHGTPIAVTAEQKGISPKDVVDKYYKIIKDAFSDLGISFDNFSRTTKELHYRNSQEFFLRVLEKGFVYKKTVERPYCPACKKFLPDRYVRGACPYCKSEDERGDQCEKCGKQLEPHELLDSYCAICKGSPGQRETEHWFFRLSEFSQKLKEWISEQEHWPDNARNFSLGWISEGLEDRAITRDLDWGVPVPVEGAKGKVLYVWFDAPIGYISSTMEWGGKSDKWRRYWQEPCKVVHFIGKDNIPFHAIIWPGMLMAHENYNLPWQISSNEYLNLEGRKMSTSRGWVIWLHDILGEFDPDLVRYYLLSINPAKHDSDFSLKEFQHKINSELIGTLGNFINRVMVFIEKNNGCMIPEPVEFDELDSGMLETIRSSARKVGDGIENFRFQPALNALLAIAAEGNEYFQHKEPWKKENGTTLYLSVNLVRTLAILMHPFLPFSAQRVWRMLGLKGRVNEQEWNSAGEVPIDGGHKIGKVEPLYGKIEDERIEEFGKKFLKSDGESKMDMVKFEDFKRMDLRIGRIKAVENIPNADKLYLLKVDLGSLGERQLVAGISDWYKKKDLMDKKIVVVVNLEPAEIRGHKSEGMLLAADLDGRVVLLVPDKEVKEGTKVK